MKRGGPLARRTPLVNKTPLVTRSALVSRTSLCRGGAIAAVSLKRRKANTQRQVVVSAMREAAAGRCARCGRRDQPVHGHERQGGSRRHRTMLNPECVLCVECNGWCEDNPQTAAWTGWKVSAKWPHAHQLTATQAVALDGAVVEFEIPEDAA